MENNIRITLLLAAFIENLQERNLHRQELTGLRAELKGSRESKNLEAPRVRKSDHFRILHSERRLKKALSKNGLLGFLR